MYHLKVTQNDRNYFNTVTNNGKNMGGFSYIVSIVCPDETVLISPIGPNHKIYQMWDIDRALVNNYRKYLPPTHKQVYTILKDAYSHYIDCINNHTECRILVHCDAGISRSSAVALGILWNIVHSLFNSTRYINPKMVKLSINIQKDICSTIVDSENSIGLKRFIDGRFNPLVKPNRAILKHLKKILENFPW